MRLASYQRGLALFGAVLALGAVMMAGGSSLKSSSAYALQAIHTRTTLASSNNPMLPNAPVAFTATVTNANQAIILDGSVFFTLKTPSGTITTLGCLGGNPVSLSHTYPQTASCSLGLFSPLVAGSSPYKVKAYFNSAGGGYASSSDGLKEVVD